MIADLKMDVAKKYGMVQPKASTTQAVRAVFIIDPEAKVRAMTLLSAINRKKYAGNQETRNCPAEK